MHLAKLQQAQDIFLTAYPGGFDHPEMVAIGKKHNVNRLADFCIEHFTPEKFNQRDALLENWIRVISRSSMTSLFEKPKFKQFINTSIGDERNLLADSLFERLYGNAATGMHLMVNLLKRDKLAKWTMVSAVPAYCELQKEIFMKPNTVKGIIKHFELTGLDYKPTPSWDFYERYQECILQMKEKTDKSLKPNNPAFCGFLMMSLPGKLPSLSATPRPE